MTIAVVGLHFRTAPVELREKLALSGCALSMAFQELHSRVEAEGCEEGRALDEAVILSTCNRLEVYLSAHNPALGMAVVERFLAGLQNIPLDELRPHLRRHGREDAVRHLMRVAAGLDSMVLGEPQILGQVTQAFEEAHAAGLTGPVLSRLFAQAIHAGKRARNESIISRYTTSVSHAAAHLLIQEVALGQSARVLLIGAGEMAVLAAQALTRLDVRNLGFVNRTWSRAETLADEYGGTAHTWSQLDDALLWADAVICATGAPHTVIYRRDVEEAIARRAGRPLLIVDIAVPRDVEAGVGQIPGVLYRDIDDLQSVVDANLELRRAAVPQVEAIIHEEIVRFGEWYSGRQVTPVIRNLRDWAQKVVQEEVRQTLNRLPEADERTQRVVSRMAHRLVNRLLHEPTTRLRLQAAEGNGVGYALAVRELFALDATDSPEQNV